MRKGVGTSGPETETASCGPFPGAETASCGPLPVGQARHGRHLGQAWIFEDVSNLDLGSMVQSFGKLIKSVKFDGFVGMGQIVHGTDNGESVYIYGTYSDLNAAFNFGPESKKDAEAFAEFFNILDKSADYSKTFTRVLIKRY